MMKTRWVAHAGPSTGMARALCGAVGPSLRRCAVRPGRQWPSSSSSSSSIGSSRRITRAAAPRCCAQHQEGSGGSGTFTITTPLYYVNAAPHMGSAYPTIAADVVARFQRLQGRRVRFLTGTDEHGEKIALAAAKRDMEPQQHCDDIAASYKALWQQLDISYDAFVRTTGGQHAELVSEVLQRVWDKGDIYKANYEGWYCVDCEEYKDESELLPGDEHACPTHRKPCTHRKEENYFFALSRYQEQLTALLEGDESFVAPAARRNEVLGWVKDGVRDFSISRAAVEWGIPLPQDPSQTVYVWFDALNGYLSGLLPEASSSRDSSNGSSNGSEASEASTSGSSVEAALSSGWPADVHVIGKDILRFHAVYWPGMLMSAGLPLPKKVFGHGFLTKDGLKMGKALGNTLDPAALTNAYGADAVRYYFMREVVFGADGNFSEGDFREKVNAALANNIGNMLNRTLNLLKKNCGGQLPISSADLPANHPLRLAAAEYIPQAAAAYERMAFHNAAEAVLAIAGRGNLFLEEMAPWTAFKKGSDADKVAAGEVLVAVLEAARIVAVALAPITPGLSSRIYQQLGLGQEALQSAHWEADTAWGQLKAGQATAEPEPVFARSCLEGDYVTEPAPVVAAPAKAGKGGGGKQKAAKSVA